MESEDGITPIAIIEVSIMTFANEGYTVKYDFRKNVISWRDNYMWNNNFTRALNEEKVELVKESLPEIGVLSWIEAYNSGKNLSKIGSKSVLPGEWKINIEFEDGSKTSGGASQHFPKRWNELKALIEKTTGCHFTLR
ncbi:MAG: hypothetical protein K5745_05830 [Saccharofermentans sp.]|nr:hypothetical protein [Saccharofermentans sp.]